MEVVSWFKMAEVWIVNRSYVSNIRRASANPDTLWGERTQWEWSNNYCSIRFIAFLNRIGGAGLRPRRPVAGGRRVLSLRNPWARLCGSWCTAASQCPHRDPDLLQGGGSVKPAAAECVSPHQSPVSRRWCWFSAARVLRSCSAAAGGLGGGVWSACSSWLQQHPAVTAAAQSAPRTILTILTLLFKHI